MIKSRRIFLSMGNISDKFMEKIKAHNIYVLCRFLEFHVIYERMWKNMVEPDIPKVIICNTEHARCMLDN
jgi:hypothetical protein